MFSEMFKVLFMFEKEDFEDLADLMMMPSTANRACETRKHKDKTIVLSFREADILTLEVICLTKLI